MVWGIVVSVLFWFLIHAHQKIGRRLGFKKSEKKKGWSEAAPDIVWKTILIGVLSTIGSLAVVVLVNVLYVMNQSRKGNSSDNGNRQISYSLLFFVAIFKASWANIVVPLLIANLRNRIYLGPTYWLRFKLLLILFNTIVAPVLASAFIGEYIYLST